MLQSESDEQRDARLRATRIYGDPYWAHYLQEAKAVGRWTTVHVAQAYGQDVAIAMEEARTVGDILDLGIEVEDVRGFLLKAGLSSDDCKLLQAMQLEGGGR